MAIRDKIRARFSKAKPTSPPNSPPSQPSIPGHYTGRTDIEYYKPHEIPKSKYRGRVDRAHQDKLEAFSLEDAFQAARRSSVAMSGTFSPGGTKAFSRRASYVSNVGAQTPAVRSRRSSLSSDANISFSVPSSGSASTHLNSIPVASATDHEDGLGFGTSGLSRTETVVGFNPSVNKDLPKIQLERQATLTDLDASSYHIEHHRSSDDMPFTTEELTQAMTRATITPPLTTRRTSVAVL